MRFPKLYECDPQKNTECNKRNCGNASTRRGKSSPGSRPGVNSSEKSL